VTIESYINNLDYRQHAALYQSIARIFERFVPMFERTLTHLLQPICSRLEYTYPMYSDDDEERQNPIQPTIGDFMEPIGATHHVSLRGRRLQVIVKLADIVLTPSNARYAGGVWHVEGMRNESIVASGIYYYASHNITESRLHFRQAVKEPEYEQDDRIGPEEVYGLRDEGPLNQTLGSVVTREGRCITFPNIYQHRVAPFSLSDPSRAGVRKILVFFLVDPAVSILSTASVAPQQAHHFAHQLATIPYFAQLPYELRAQIASKCDWLMTQRQAREHRDKLMRERKYLVEQNTREMFERSFSLCEH
jgi:hypothetical protein